MGRSTYSADIKLSLTESVYRELFKMIESPEYKIGEIIPSGNDLARRFNVSRPTVNKAIQQLKVEGYLEGRPGAGTIIISKPLIHKKELVFGLIFPMYGMEGFFTPLAQQIASSSVSHGFKVIWGGQFAEQSLAESDSIESMADFYIDQQVSGVFLSPRKHIERSREVTERMLQKLNSASIPVVLMDDDYAQFPACSTYDLVTIDNFRAGYTLANHFLNQGSKRIDFVTRPNSGAAVLLRLHGMQCAMADRGIEPSAEWVHVIDEHAVDAGGKLKACGAGDIVCHNDMETVKLLQKLHSESFSIPKDFRLAGFDGSQISAQVSPQLTTIEQPCGKLAEYAIELMKQRIRRPDSLPRRIFSDFTLIERESSRYQSR